MTYILYYSPGACSLAAHIALEELGVAYAIELVSIPDGATSHPAYLAINPKGRVPALRIDGERKVLTELPAILTYLARKHPEGGLLPTINPVLEARCHEWLAWLTGWLHGVGFGLLWRPGRFDSDESRHEALQARGRQIILEAFAQIERQLDHGHMWGMPFGFSVVDPALFVFYQWGIRIGLPMQADYPAWTSIAARVAERPAVRRVLEREGITIAQ